MPSRRTDPLDPGRGTDQAEPESPAAVAERLGPEYRPPRRQRPPQRTPCLCSGEAYRTDTELDPIGKQRKREARLQPVLTEQQHFQNVRNARPDTFSKTSARSFPRLKSEPSKPQRLCEDTPSVHTTEYPRHAGSNPVHTEMPPRTEAESAQSFLRGFRENFQSLQLLRRGRCQILLGVLLQRRLLDQSGGRRLLQHPRLAHLAEEMRPESLSQYRINYMLQKLFVGKNQTVAASTTRNHDRNTSSRFFTPLRQRFGCLDCTALYTFSTAGSDGSFGLLPLCETATESS